MKTVGLITEYNPFHNGHKLHIEKAKELTGADNVIVVMSGNFVQRGAPAIMPKHLRAESALLNGVSLVVELPVCYATGSAEQFAFGAVSLLNKLGCIDFLCFGSECGDIHLLSEIASVLNNEPASYQFHLREELRKGKSFPAARQAALEILFPDKDFGALLGKPNNILGIEYLKALQRLKSSIVPITLKRIASNYHDTDLQDIYSSASAIRNMIEHDYMSQIINQVPVSSIQLMFDSYQKRFPVIANDFSILTKHQLLRETKTSLLAYADISEELANRIINERNNFIDLNQFCSILKTKDATYTRISRALLHVLLDIRKTDYTEIEYAHVLGFQKKHAHIFTRLKETSSIPLLTKLCATNFLSDNARTMLEKDIAASDLYESMITEKFKNKFINEKEHQIVRV